MLSVKKYDIVEGFNGYVNYTLEGELIEDKIVRRFHDFYSLREKLIKRWPGIYIPNIPEKQLIGNMDTELIVDYI